MSGAPPRAVGDLLQSALPQLGDRLVELRLRRAWASLVGPDVARRARPDALAAGTLTVLVDNSPWLHELTLRTEAMRQRIAERFPEVRSLRFALGTLDGEPADDASPRRKPTPITDAERTEIDTATAAIPDPTLAAAARRLMTTAWRFPVTRGPITRGPITRDPITRDPITRDQ